MQNNAAESTTLEATAVLTATALQSPAQDPAVDGAASATPTEAVASAPTEPKRMGLYSLICLPHRRIHGLLHCKYSLPLDVLRLLGIFLDSNDYSHYFVCCFAVRLLHLLCSCGAYR